MKCNCNCGCSGAEAAPVVKDGPYSALNNKPETVAVSITTCAMMLADTVERLNKLYHLSEDTKTTLFGPTPEVAEKSGVNGSSPGLVHDMVAMLRQADYLINKTVANLVTIKEGQ